MNIQQLRQSVKEKWLGYYQENRQWLTKLGVWVNCDGQRRPSSSFILATLTTLEPGLTEMLPLIVDLSSNPDRIILALGLNFNPDEQLEKLAKAGKLSRGEKDTSVRMLPAGTRELSVTASRKPNVYAEKDEECEGIRGDRERRSTDA